MIEIDLKIMILDIIFFIIDIYNTKLLAKIVYKLTAKYAD